jgi:hypothetical protein
MRARKSSASIVRPEGSSRAIEVIVTSGSPQAITHENGARSTSTLTANPCVEIPRETCTPIEAIFRSCTHTPV